MERGGAIAYKAYKAQEEGRPERKYERCKRLKNKTKSALRVKRKSALRVKTALLGLEA